MKKVAIFDIDGTLVSVNTTEDFIDFYLKKYNRVKFVFFAFYRVFLKDILILFKKDVRKINISFLKNESFNGIEKAAQDYVKTLKPYINPEIEEKINDYRKNNYYLIFLSATIDFIVKALVELLFFDNGKGSTLKFNEENICLGEFENDILGNKLEALKTVLKEDIDYDDSIVLSDNREDEELMKAFPKSIAVIKSKLEYIFWTSKNINVIFIPPFRPFKKYFKKYILPLGYFFYTRGVPIFWMTFIINSTIAFHLLNLLYFHLFNWNHLLEYLISLLAFYSIYEIHYLINDCHAFQEQFPTLRIDKFTCQKTIFIIIGKLAFLTIFLIILSLYFKCKISLLLFSYLVLSFVYILHNNTSFKYIKQYFTYPSLLLSHLLIPLLIFEIPFTFIIFAFLIFGILKASQLYYLAKLDNNILNKRRRFYNVSLPIYIIYFVILICFTVVKQPLFQYLVISGLYFVGEELIFTLKDLKYILSN